MLDSITAAPRAPGETGNSKPHLPDLQTDPYSSPGQHKTHLPKVQQPQIPLSSSPLGISREAQLTAHPGCKNLPGTDLDQDGEFLTSSETTNHSRATTNHISKNRTYQPCCFSADKSVVSHWKVKKCLHLIPHTKPWLGNFFLHQYA